jgi:hypothetical protein
VTAQEQLKNKVAIVWTASEREEGNRWGTTPLENIIMCICIEHIRLAQMSYMNISFSLSLSLHFMGNVTS